MTSRRGALFFQLHRALLGERQHILRQRQHLASIFWRRGLADQVILVIQPGLFKADIGGLDFRRRRIVLQLDQLAVESHDGRIEHLFATLDLHPLANLEIGFGHALRQHALTTGLVDG